VSKYKSHFAEMSLNISLLLFSRGVGGGGGGRQIRHLPQQGIDGKGAQD